MPRPDASVCPRLTGRQTAAAEQVCPAATVRFLGCTALLLLVWLGFAPASAGERPVVETGSGDLLELRVSGEAGEGPLFVWIDNQYAETERPREIAAKLAQAGATVWQVDLLDDLFLERTAEAVRSIDGEPVADLIATALDSGLGPVVLVAMRSHRRPSACSQLPACWPWGRGLTQRSISCSMRTSRCCRPTA